MTKGIIMTDQIKQSEINSAAWAACDTFRGAVDPAQYKDYILTALFIKYISDVWRDHYETYANQFGEDKERIRRRLDRERFILPDVVISNPTTGKEEDRFIADFYSLYDRRDQANIGELINITLDQIEEANKSKLEGVFRNIDFNSEGNLGKPKDRNRRLKMMLEDFNKPQLDMRPSRVSEDVIGNTYIYLIQRFGSDAGKKAGEFYTPAKVSELLAKLAAPKPGDKICDPACGSGGLLINASKEVGGDNFSLYGMEVNGSTWALARMNMFLHGMDSARIDWCNTLTSPALVENDKLMKFNIVVANPPFSLDKWGAEQAEHDRYHRFWRGVPPKSKGDYAFISHMVEAALEKEGRVAVIVPHGVLFRAGAEGRIRQKLVEDNLLDAVIGLPANLFTTTGIPVAILILDRSREKGGRNEHCNDILFINASRNYKPGKNQNSLDNPDIERIVGVYRERREIEKYSHLTTIEEVVGNNYNLNISRYVEMFEAAQSVDMASLEKEIYSLEDELAKTKEEIKRTLRELTQ